MGFMQGGRDGTSPSPTGLWRRLVGATVVVARELVPVRRGRPGGKVIRR